MGEFAFTFVWPAALFPPLTLRMTDLELSARDPEGKSVVAGKLASTHSRSVEFSLVGPLNQ